MNKLITLLTIIIYLSINIISEGVVIKTMVDPNNPKITIVSVKGDSGVDLFHVNDFKGADGINVSLRIKNSSSSVAVFPKKNVSYIVYYRKDEANDKNKHISKDLIKSFIKISKSENGVIRAKVVDFSILDYAYISTIFLEWNDVIDVMDVLQN